MARYKVCEKHAGGDWNACRAGYWKAMGITKAYIAVGLTREEAKMVKFLIRAQSIYSLVFQGVALKVCKRRSPIKTTTKSPSMTSTTPF